MTAATIRLHKFQSKAIRASNEDLVPFVLLLSGVQGGKTFCGAAWELTQWQRKPKGDHLICAPTYKHLHQSTLRKLNALMPKGWATYNSQRACYENAWGGFCYVRSTEDPDAIEGISADSVWGDEAGKFTVKTWENIQARRSATRGPVFLTTTPYGLNWLKTDFFDKARAGLPEYRVIHFRSIDSPHFPREEWERAKRDLPEQVFNRKFGGMFTRLEGLVYADFIQERMTLDPFNPPRAWEKIGGIDFGFSQKHPFAASVWTSPSFKDPTTKIIKVGEHKKHGMLLESHYQAIRELEKRTGPISVWYADPSAAQQIAELRRMGLHLKVALNAVEWGILKVIKLMRNDRYRLVSAWCPQTIDELETYHRDEHGDIEKDNDHLMDADRYALATHLSAKKGVRIL